MNKERPRFNRFDHPNPLDIRTYTWERDPFEEKPGTQGSLWWTCISDPMRTIRKLNGSETSTLSRTQQGELYESLNETKKLNDWLTTKNTIPVDQCFNIQAFEIIAQYFDKLCNLIKLHLIHAIENQHQQALQNLIFIIKETGSITCSPDIFHLFATAGRSALLKASKDQTLVITSLVEYLVLWNGAIQLAIAKKGPKDPKNLKELLANYMQIHSLFDGQSEFIEKLVNHALSSRSIGNIHGDNLMVDELFFKNFVTTMLQEALVREYQAELADSLEASNSEGIVEERWNDIQKITTGILEKPIPENLNPSPSHGTAFFDLLKTNIAGPYQRIEYLINPKFKTQIASSYAVLVLKAIAEAFKERFPDTHNDLMAKLIDQLCAKCNQTTNYRISALLELSSADNPFEPFILPQQERLNQLRDPFSPRLIRQSLGIQPSWLYTLFGVIQTPFLRKIVRMFVLVSALISAIAAHWSIANYGLYRTCLTALAFCSFTVAFYFIGMKFRSARETQNQIIDENIDLEE